MFSFGWRMAPAPAPHVEGTRHQAVSAELGDEPGFLLGEAIGCSGAAGPPLPSRPRPTLGAARAPDVYPEAHGYPWPYPLN